MDHKRNKNAKDERDGDGVYQPMKPDSVGSQVQHIIDGRRSKKNTNTKQAAVDQKVTIMEEQYHERVEEGNKRKWTCDYACQKEIGLTLDHPHCWMCWDTTRQPHNQCHTKQEQQNQAAKSKKANDKAGIGHGRVKNARQGMGKNWEKDEESSSLVC